jgi:hypothetical protein
VPYSVADSLDAGLITSLRVYFSLEALVRQLHADVPTAVSV